MFVLLLVRFAYFKWRNRDQFILKLFSRYKFRLRRPSVCLFLYAKISRSSTEDLKKLHQIFASCCTTDHSTVWQRSIKADPLRKITTPVGSLISVAWILYIYNILGQIVCLLPRLPEIAYYYSFNDRRGQFISWSNPSLWSTNEASLFILELYALTSSIMVFSIQPHNTSGMPDSRSNYKF